MKYLLKNLPIGYKLSENVVLQESLLLFITGGYIQDGGY